MIDKSQFTPLAWDLRKLFYWRQKDLLWMINTDAGRSLLGIKDERRIARVVPNGYHFANGLWLKEKDFIANFYTWDKVAFTLLPLLETLDILKELHKLDNPYKALLHYAGLERYNYPFILHTTTTFSPAAGKGSVHNDSFSPYATGQAAGTGTGTNQGEAGNEKSGSNFFIYRGAWPYDSSSLTAAATIKATSNTFKRLVGAGTIFNTDSDSVSIVSSGQASTSSLAASDFGSFGITKFASDIALGSFNNAGNNDFVLNTSGIANINKTGFSKFAARLAKDISATQPSGRNTCGVITDASCILSVEYTTPSGGFFIAAQ